MYECKVKVAVRDRLASERLSSWSWYYLSANAIPVVTLFVVGAEAVDNIVA